VMSNMSSPMRNAMHGPASSRHPNTHLTYTSPTAQLHVIDAQSGKLLWIYDLGPTVQPGELSVSMSRDGSYISFTNVPTAYVLEKATGQLRAGAINLPFYAPVQIDSLGNYLTTGSDSAVIYEWNTQSSSYTLAYNIPIAGWYFWTSVSSLNGESGTNSNLAAFGYSNADVTQLRVDVYSMTSGQQLLSWIGPLNQQGQTMPTLSFHMNYLGVGSWGDAAGGDPQILLFDVTTGTSASTPIFTYTTPGSMFAIEIEVASAAYPPSITDESDQFVPTAPSDTVNLIACGKHVHASEFGNGGDAFAFQLVIPTSESTSVSS